jgi:hypothetical protein
MNFCAPFAGHTKMDGNNATGGDDGGILQRPDPTPRFYTAFHPQRFSALSAKTSVPANSPPTQSALAPGTESSLNARLGYIKVVDAPDEQIRQRIIAESVASYKASARWRVVSDHGAKVVDQVRSEFTTVSGSRYTEIDI